MNRIVCLILAFVLIFSFAACSKKTDTDISDVSDISDINTNSSLTEETESSDGKTENNHASNELPLDETVSKDSTVNIEGEEEKISLIKFERNEYEIWLDNEYFYAVSDDHDENGATVYGRYNSSGSVSMVVQKYNVSASKQAETTQKVLKNNFYDVGDGVINAKDFSVSGVLHISGATINNEDYTFSGAMDDCYSIYFVPYTDTSCYTITLHYPKSAVEGYAVRLEAMVREIVFK